MAHSSFSRFNDCIFLFIDFSLFLLAVVKTAWLTFGGNLIGVFAFGNLPFYSFITVRFIKFNLIKSALFVVVVIESITLILIRV